MTRTRKDRRQRTFPLVSPVDGFATTQDAMAFLRLSQNKVRELLEKGELEDVYVGRARRIPWRSLRRFTGDEPLIASPITEEDAALIARMLLSVSGHELKHRDR